MTNITQEMIEDELDKISRNKLDDENVNSDEEPVKNDND